MKTRKILLFLLLTFMFLSQAFGTYSDEFEDKGIVIDNLEITKDETTNTSAIGQEAIEISKPDDSIGQDEDIEIEKNSSDENKIIKISDNLNVEGGFGKPVDSDELILNIIKVKNYTIFVIILALFLCLSIVSVFFIINIGNTEKTNFHKLVIIKILIAFLFFSGFAVSTYLWIINNAEKNVNSNIESSSEGIEIKLIK